MKQLAVKFGSGRWAVSVLLTVPQTWELSKTQPGSCCRTPPTVCVVEAGSDYAGNLSNCRLAVTYAPTGDSISPNEPVPPAQYPTCRNWSTAQESNWTIAGRQGEYRRFVDNCSGASYEQWTIMTGPQIAFWHPITTQCGHALAAGIVNSAVLPPQTDRAPAIRRRLHPSDLQAGRRLSRAARPSGGEPGRIGDQHQPGNLRLPPRWARIHALGRPGVNSGGIWPAICPICSANSRKGRTRPTDRRPSTERSPT